MAKTHRQHYRKTRDRSGRRRRTHRVQAEAALGRPLRPGEIVHHRDGDKTNNDPANLLVLSSQAQHASLEFHLRRQQQGFASLFPELLLGGLHERHEGTLFEHLLLPHPVHQRKH